jgi:hypothetical protein
MKMEQSVPKRQHIEFSFWGITQKKTYNVQNTAKVLKLRNFVIYVEQMYPPKKFFLGTGSLENV